MAKKRVFVLYEVWWPDEPGDDVRPPGMLLDPAQGVVRDEPADVHHEVFDALGRLGYAPQFFVLEGDRESLARLSRARASLVFNLTESYAGDDTLDLNVAAYLELLGVPFTGSDARALHLGQDKILAKKLLKFEGIPTPEFFTVAPGQKTIRNELGFPLIVKPSREDGSIGIDTGSVVYAHKPLVERVRYVQERFKGEVLVERFVEGREIYVAVLGNDSPEALPPVELDLTGVPEGLPRIAGTEVKWWTRSEIYARTPPIYPKKLSRARIRRAQRVAVDAYRALGLRDYGRVDLRLADDGTPYVLEVNPNPWLATECELFMAWRKTGRGYDELIAKIVDGALSRHARGRQ